MKLPRPVPQHLLNLGENSIHHFAKAFGNKFAEMISRRSLLQWGISGFLLAVFDRPSYSALLDPRVTEKSLSFYNTHTGESVKALYWACGKYIPEGLGAINQILRDYRTNEVKAIEPKLLDLLHSLRRKLETENPFHVISGYRCPSTNASLLEQGRGVVKNSLHLHGLAADVRLPGLPLSTLRSMAMSLKGGGVGYYPKSDFLHIDVGRVRVW